MWNALKKAIGMDEESKALRQKLDEEERREREERVRQHKEALKKDLDSAKE